MLTSLPYLLSQAQKFHYAVGAFNVYNLETVQAVIAAAEKMKSPIVIQTSEAAIEYAGMENLGALVHLMAKKSKVPIVFHLDHGKDEKLVVEAIKSGWYGSVMFDGSALPLKENLASTKRLVKLAHSKGVAVEAELGAIAGIEDFVSVKEREALLTDPKQAADFVRETGCDALAIAIGTKHGAYKFHGDCQLDSQRLQEIHKSVKIPLVLHGASGVPANVKNLAIKFGAKIGEAKGVSDSAIKKAISLGICKINIDTDLRIAFLAGLHEFIEKNPKNLDPRAFLSAGKDLVSKTVEQKMRLFGSAKKR